MEADHSHRILLRPVAMDPVNHHLGDLYPRSFPCELKRVEIRWVGLLLVNPARCLVHLNLRRPHSLQISHHHERPRFRWSLHRQRRSLGTLTRLAWLARMLIPNLRRRVMDEPCQKRNLSSEPKKWAVAHPKLNAAWIIFALPPRHLLQVRVGMLHKALQAVWARGHLAVT